MGCGTRVSVEKAPHPGRGPEEVRNSGTINCLGVKPLEPAPHQFKRNLAECSTRAAVPICEKFFTGQISVPVCVVLLLLVLVIFYLIFDTARPAEARVTSGDRTEDQD